MMGYFRELEAARKKRVNLILEENERRDEEWRVLRKRRETIFKIFFLALLWMLEVGITLFFLRGGEG